MGKMKFHHF